ncbi:MAG: hypothetical protein NUW01_05615 [Gemmatimonadaceae bacterium]|nr:hypothetical protein [Gemmatimonadaceae bacterium]
MNTFIVTWKKKGQSLPFLIDLNDENAAIRAGIQLNEAGMYDVVITVTEYEEDEDMKARIWARVQERMQEMPKVFA